MLTPAQRHHLEERRIVYAHTHSVAVAHAYARIHTRLVEVERRDVDVHEALLDSPQEVAVLVVLHKQLRAPE